MFTGRRTSVRLNLTVAILLTVLLSYLLSSGVANYFNYLAMRSMRQEMVKHPGVYPNPIPEPKFGVVEFLTGRPPFPRNMRPGFNRPFRDKNEARPLERPPMDKPRDRPHGPAPVFFGLSSLITRLVIALGLALLAAAWLGRKFTRPLTQLANGAKVFQSGDFSYRIPTGDKNEFDAVATAMNEMAQRVYDQLNRLEKDAERRRQFLADIAHEFRSPVTTMRTMAGALQDGMAEEPVRRERAVSALVGTSERLLRLVQDLMELAKLDLDDFPLNVRQLDLRPLLESVIQSHVDDAAAAKVVLQPLQCESPVIASVDPDRLVQVINNLLENAISYSGEGSEVKVSMVDKPTEVSIKIFDSGKGIRETDLPYVLDPFFRADAARTPGDCHSGLGLSIACRLIEAHDGKLTLTSEEGKGTTAEIVVPK